MKLKIFAVLIMTLIQSSAFAAPSGKDRVYGLHLFFDEKEYIDIMTLKAEANGTFSGSMIVPNDFEGRLENVHIASDRVSFDLFVPKNPNRPKDMIFHYRGLFFDRSQRQIIGYVTLKNQPGFVASFTAFLRQ